MYLQALQHADAALEIASKHRYRNSDLETLYLARDSLQALLDGDMWPEDLFFEPAMSHFDTGMEFFEEDDYAAAIKSFEAARETHGTSSGAIQTMSGEARPCRRSRWLRPRLSALSRLLRLLPLALLHPVADGGLGEDVAGIVCGRRTAWHRWPRQLHSTWPDPIEPEDEPPRTDNLQADALKTPRRGDGPWRSPP